MAADRRRRHADAYGERAGGQRWPGQQLLEHPRASAVRDRGGDVGERGHVGAAYAGDVSALTETSRVVRSGDDTADGPCIYTVPPPGPRRARSARWPGRAPRSRRFAEGETHARRRALNRGAPETRSTRLTFARRAARPQRLFPFPGTCPVAVLVDRYRHGTARLCCGGRRRAHRRRVPTPRAQTRPARTTRSRACLGCCRPASPRRSRSTSRSSSRPARRRRRSCAVPVLPVQDHAAARPTTAAGSSSSTSPGTSVRRGPTRVPGRADTVLALAAGVLEGAR